MRPLFEVIGRLPAWETIALQHGLAAWLADELAASGQPVGERLQVGARAQIGQAVKLKRLSLDVLDALHSQGVRPVLLKGYGLASRLYPAAPLCRPSVDVDVLVLPSQLDVAGAALKRLGLEAGKVPGIEHAEEHHHVPWVGRAGLVELHFRLFSGFGGRAFDDVAVWARRVEGALDGRPVSWLCPEDEFLYLAVHAANHGFLRLSWLVDLAQYLSVYPSLDWQSMSDRAHQAGFFTPASAALSLLARTLLQKLPDDARAAFRLPRARTWLDEQVFALPRVVAARWATGRVSSFLLRLYLVDSPQQGMRHVVDGLLRYSRQVRHN